MKFGKLADISQVDFTLPVDPVENIVLFDQLSAVAEPEVYIGCTGWSMKEWVGKVYPKGAKAKDFLRHYGKQFNTIELNTTHYRIPSPEMIEKWYRETPADFRFCPKIPQTISHRKDLGVNDTALGLFCEVIVGLREKLGCCFMQLPPYFSFEDLPRLAHFLERFPREIPLAVEFRHASFFDSKDSFNAAAALLQEFEKATVITDVAGRRDVLHNRLTNAVAMVRFVGNGLHDSDYTRLDSWADKLKEWTGKGIKEVYFFPHEPDNLLAPEAADYFTNKIKTNLPGSKTRGPALINENEGEQLALF